MATSGHDRLPSTAKGTLLPPSARIERKVVHMELLKLLRTASPEANVLAFSASMLLLLKTLVLNRFPARLAGAYEVGMIVEAVLGSVIASYVFYILVIHVKAQSDRTILRPYIERHATRLVGNCLSQLSDISQASGVALEFKQPSTSDIASAFSHIAPYSSAPLLVSTQPQQYANWFQYFSYHNERSRDSIGKLLDQLPFLDAMLVSRITAIDDCTHFTSTSLMLSVQVRNSDLSAWAPQFHAYCLLCVQLEAHLVALGYSSSAT